MTGIAILIGGFVACVVMLFAFVAIAIYYRDEDWSPVATFAAIVCAVVCIWCIVKAIERADAIDGLKLPPAQPAATPAP